MMLARAKISVAIVLLLTLVHSVAAPALAQTPAARPAAKAASKAPAAKAPAASESPKPAASSTADAAKKREILSSQRWRRAIFELNEWFNSQQIYTPEQVEKIKADFNVRVARMSAAEVQKLLADLDAKFQIIETPQAQEARAWMAQYLSYFSDKKRQEMLKDVPNVATMSAAELSREIMKIEQKRATIERDQAAFNQGQQSQVAAANQARAAAQAAIAARPSMEDAATFSPYRSTQSAARPFDNVHRPSDGMQYYVNSWGGFGFTFSPSSW
jgi:hypothetical protein